MLVSQCVSSAGWRVIASALLWVWRPRPAGRRRGWSHTRMPAPRGAAVVGCTTCTRPRRGVRMSAKGGLANDPGRARACNPRLCRPMPYPLGHGASCFAAAGRARMARDSAAKLGNGSMTVRTCVRACMRACARARAPARLHAHGGRAAAWTALLHRARF